ncbi:hypothetical protein HYC85_029365 [Camellia sinensis]|uniref:Glycosyltransferase subfamily 4-like N-terminal domain-containing protein n=1 Tax=Camellia sinensis TaxID=4442 RepID=A0A7J7G1R4_CAMSI|nr:hypothetical protein HYC85_029365 [Camellia sinensis]
MVPPPQWPTSETSALSTKGRLARPHQNRHDIVCTVHLKLARPDEPHSHTYPSLFIQIMEAYAEYTPLEQKLAHMDLEGSTSAIKASAWDDAISTSNPLFVPTLVVVMWASWLRRSAFIVDWHNFGYTLLALSLGRSSVFVAIYHWFEKHFGKMANGSSCVTRAMQHELAQNRGINVAVLYDQPPDFFHPTSLEEKHKLKLSRVGSVLI